MLLNLRRVRCSFHIIFLMHCRFFNSLLLPFLFNVKILVQSQLHQHPGFLSKFISPRGRCVIFSILLCPPALCGKGIHGPAPFRIQQRTANPDYQHGSQHEADLSRMAETQDALRGWELQLQEAGHDTSIQAGPGGRDRSRPGTKLTFGIVAFAVNFLLVIDALCV